MTPKEQLQRGQNLFINALEWQMMGIISKESAEELYDEAMRMRHEAQDHMVDGVL